MTIITATNPTNIDSTKYEIKLVKHIQIDKQIYKKSTVQNQNPILPINNGWTTINNWNQTKLFVNFIYTSSLVLVCDFCDVFFYNFFNG